MVMLLAEFLLFVAGIAFLARRGILIGGYLLPRPFTVYIGLLFMLVLPVVFLGGVAFGAAEGVKTVRGGVIPDTKKLAAKALYIDFGVAGGALLGAIGIAAYGTRRYEMVYLPPEEVEGIRDYAAEREQEKLEDRVRRAAQDVQ